jgi:acyl-CoA synthetase (AMP-forming)/AMP-acid ligase II
MTEPARMATPSRSEHPFKLTESSKEGRLEGFASPRSAKLANELSAFARETSPYKHPRKIEFVESLDPVKTISGKIRRKDLREAEYGTGAKQVHGTEFTLRSLRDSA